MLKRPKYNRPDTPLAETPEPVGMQQERERQVKESVKGSSMRLMKEKNDKDNADKALKEAAMKRGMDVLSRKLQY
jgi:hypothetical protein